MWAIGTPESWVRTFDLNFRNIFADYWSPSISVILIQVKLVVHILFCWKQCLPVHWADHEEAVPELLGDVCQVPCLRTHHAPVIHQAVLNVMKSFLLQNAGPLSTLMLKPIWQTQVLKAVNFYQTRAVRSLHSVARKSRPGREGSPHPKVGDRAVDLMMPACNWSLAVLPQTINTTKPYWWSLTGDNMREILLHIQLTVFEKYCMWGVLVKHAAMEYHLLLCPTEVSWVGSAWIHSISCPHHLNTQHLPQHYVFSFQHIMTTSSWHFTDVQMYDAAPFSKREKVFNDCYKETMIRAVHSPIVLKWPFREAWLWLRHQLAWSRGNSRVLLLVLGTLCTQECPGYKSWHTCMWLRHPGKTRQGKSAIACLMLPGMLLSALEG